MVDVKNALKEFLKNGANWEVLRIPNVEGVVVQRTADSKTKKANLCLFLESPNMKGRSRYFDNALFIKVLSGMTHKNTLAVMEAISEINGNSQKANVKPITQLDGKMFNSK